MLAFLKVGSDRKSRVYLTCEDWKSDDMCKWSSHFGHRQNRSRWQIWLQMVGTSKTYSQKSDLDWFCMIERKISPEKTILSEWEIPASDVLFRKTSYLGPWYKLQIANIICTTYLELDQLSMLGFLWPWAAMPQTWRHRMGIRGHYIKVEADDVCLSSVGGLLSAFCILFYINQKINLPFPSFSHREAFV